MTTRPCEVCGTPLTPEQAWWCSPGCKQVGRDLARRRVMAYVQIAKDRAAIEAAKRAAAAKAA